MKTDPVMFWFEQHQQGLQHDHYEEKVFVNGSWWYRTSFEYRVDGSQFTGFFYANSRYDAACRL